MLVKDITDRGHIPLVLEKVAESGGVLHNQGRDGQEGQQQHVHHVQPLPYKVPCLLNIGLNQ